MISYTIEEAERYMLDTFQATWKDETHGWRSVEGLTREPYILWENHADERKVNPKGELTDEQPWIRVYMQPDNSDQAAISGADGSLRYEEEGTLVFDIYIPVNDGLKFGNRLSRVCQRAFKGKRGHGEGCGITFPRVRPLRKGVENGRWYVVSVLADYQYDEVT